MTGRIETERPVQASRARRCETIQSTEPSRFTTPKEVVGLRTESRAVTGLAEETCQSISDPPVHCHCIRSKSTDLLVKKWNAEGGSSDGLQNAKRRNDLYAIVNPSLGETNKARPSQPYPTLSAFPLSPTNVPRRV